MRLAYWLGILLALPGGMAEAETLTWKVRHEYPYSLSLAFYSANRSHEWPGNGRAYVLNKWEPFSIKISCDRFEKICYGAWAYTGRGSEYTYWGVGPNNKHGCTNCCYTCNDGEISEIVLTQNGPTELE
jgi:hypothetical protein